MKFSQFKKLVNGIDEKRFGDAEVFVGSDARCPVVDLATITGLPACDNRWHGKQPAEPNKVTIEFAA